MPIASKSGKLHMPTPAEDRAIQQGIADDPDTLELDEAFFKTARPASEVLGESVMAALTRTQDRVILRLDPDVLEALQSTGPGWQARANELLREDIASGRIQRTA